MLKQTKIWELVEKLNSFSDNQRAILEIISYGHNAVEPLRELLLSAAALHAEPRCLAAEALGIIGGPEAVQALCDALFINDVRDADPVLRFSEEIVRNRCAEELGRLGDTGAIEPLLEALKEFHLAGAALALGKLKVRRAIPYLIDRLEDDFSRDKAGAALMNFGNEVVGPLLRTLHVKKMGFETETPQSVNRRVGAIQLLASLDHSSLGCELRLLLSDPSEKVRRSAALVLATKGEDEDRQVAASVLQDFLNHEDWRVREECREALEAIQPRIHSD